ncbi:MAG: helix-turn-helix transcriptional regulator [Vicingaceae bacterium]|nr:helix-turn-helix transcriptional regulator [Vicingaceae bacterium]
MKSEEEVLIEIGLRFKFLRKEKGFNSYEHFAIEHDLSRMHYWQIEKGKANITIRTLLNILKIHDCSIEDFFKLTVDDENEDGNKKNSSDKG